MSCCLQLKARSFSFSFHFSFLSSLHATRYCKLFDDRESSLSRSLCKAEFNTQLKLECACSVLGVHFKVELKFYDP